MKSVNPDFIAGAREGLKSYLPVSFGIVPWAIATAIAMRSAGFSFADSAIMSVLVYGATAQIGTLPLIVAQASLVSVFATALVLNLRFFIFGATLSPVFKGQSRWQRLLAGHLMSDGVVASLTGRLLAQAQPAHRMGLYLGPSSWNWLLWQASTVAGLLFYESIPRSASLNYMSTIALLVLIASLSRQLQMVAVVVCSALLAIWLRHLPYRLGLFAAIVAGIACGYLLDRLAHRRRG